MGYALNKSEDLAGLYYTYNKILSELLLTNHDSEEFKNKSQQLEILDARIEEALNE